MSAIDLSFIPLQKKDFPLLLKWLMVPHVRAWWDQEVMWTPELIVEKYGTYVDGYKLEQEVKKPIHAFIIFCDMVPIGYIQYYNAYDFARDLTLEGLPQSLASFDFYIGEPGYLGKGIGVKVIQYLLKNYIWPCYEACFVETDIANIRAIRCYQNAGFKIVKVLNDNGISWMIQERKSL